MAGFIKPTPSAPLVDLRTGRINIPWLEWFLTIDSATANSSGGGGTGVQTLSDINNLAFDTPNSTGRIAYLEARVNALETQLADTPNAPGRIAYLEARVNALEAQLADVARREPANLSGLFLQVDRLTALTMGSH